MPRQITMGKAFGASLRLVAGLMPVYSKEVVIGTAAEVMRAAPPKTPVHTGARTKLGRPAYPGGGRLRASWTVARSKTAPANRPTGIPGPVDAELALAGIRSLLPVAYVLNKAARRGRRSYALYPLWGRTTDKRGRPIGSLQLPRGIRPVISSALRTARPKIKARAAAEARRRLSGGILR